MALIPKKHSALWPGWMCCVYDCVSGCVELTRHVQKGHVGFLWMGELCICVFSLPAVSLWVHIHIWVRGKAQ